ncbi:MAG TPA: serine/threonine protein kinase, partial [Sorangium sp.]|nr:serine/threonine protein kinase [Sorangium sp.]
MGTRYGRYEVIRRLAAGGMATVYLGCSRGPGGFERLVAIKVMHDHIADDPAARAMFLDEARLCARIRHPNVVATLDVADDGRFIVMEYVEGSALDGLLRQPSGGGGALPLAVILRIISDVLEGLHCAHELCDAAGAPLRLVHRDVSPQNVLVGIDGVSKVGDFGIAYAASRLASTQGSQLKGKLPYMAPEQLEGGPVDRRVDVYASGCVLWEMVTGERLFRGASEAAIACAVLAGPEHPPSAHRDIPSALDAAIMRALAPKSQRYDTALAFAQALEQAADEAGITPARARQVGALIPTPVALTVAAVEAAVPSQPLSSSAKASSPGAENAVVGPVRSKRPLTTAALTAAASPTTAALTDTASSTAAALTDTASRTTAALTTAVEAAVPSPPPPSSAKSSSPSAQNAVVGPVRSKRPLTAAASSTAAALTDTSSTAAALHTDTNAVSPKATSTTASSHRQTLLAVVLVATIALAIGWYASDANRTPRVGAT